MIPSRCRTPQCTARRRAGRRSTVGRRRRVVCAEGRAPPDGIVTVQQLAGHDTLASGAQSCREGILAGSASTAEVAAHRRQHITKVARATTSWQSERDRCERSRCEWSKSSSSSQLTRRTTYNIRYSTGHLKRRAPTAALRGSRRRGGGGRGAPTCGASRCGPRRGARRRRRRRRGRREPSAAKLRSCVRTHRLRQPLAVRPGSFSATSRQRSPRGGRPRRSCGPPRPSTCRRRGPRPPPPSPFRRRAPPRRRGDEGGGSGGRRRCGRRGVRRAARDSPRPRPSCCAHAGASSAPSPLVGENRSSGFSRSGIDSSAAGGASAVSSLPIPPIISGAW